MDFMKVRNRHKSGSFLTLAGPYEEEQDFREFVQNINTKLDGFGMELRRGFDPMEDANVSGDVARMAPFYCLVNTQADDEAKSASDWPESGQAYLKHLLECIVMAAPQHLVSGTRLLHQAKVLAQEGKLRQMAPSAAEALLDRFVTEKWLNQ